MNLQPTGTVLGTADGYDLVVKRRFQAPIQDVWDSITDPARTARWYGPWRGEASPGALVEIQMAYEDGSPWFPMRIDACEPPHRLAVTQIEKKGDWRIELTLREEAGTTELRLVQHLDSGRDVGSIGPGWEYYMDMLAASRRGETLPKFDDYRWQHAHFEDALGRLS
jgi:uncharacterized protein YndB with AHSA1/START domain